MCQVRRELYSQCFDELIRQSTINCAERGLLMLRVRDELKMTLMAYQVKLVLIYLMLMLSLSLHCKCESGPL